LLKRSRATKKAYNPSGQPIPWGQIRSTTLRALHDEQLVFDRQRFRCHCTMTARLGQLCQGHQQMGNQDKHFSHGSELYR
jgi:hypothetical protein